MEHREAVELQTVPDFRLGNRVIGVTTNEGTVWYRNQRCGVFRKPQHTPEQIVPIPIEVPDVFADRLVSFFDKYLRPMPSDRRPYNCHRFALWMRGIVDTTSAVSLEFSPEIQTITYGGKTQDGELELGQHGLVVRQARSASGTISTTAEHSMIGLGLPDGLDRIDVHGMHGYMYVGSQATAVAPYLRASAECQVQVATT